MLANVMTWVILAVGAASSTYLDVLLAGQPQQLWLPLLNIAAFALVSGLLVKI